MVFGLPFFSDGFLVFTTRFVVQDLEVNRMAAGFEMLHDGIVRLNSVFILAGLNAACRIVLVSQW